VLPEDRARASVGLPPARKKNRAEVDVDAPHPPVVGGAAAPDEVSDDDGEAAGGGVSKEFGDSCEMVCEYILGAMADSAVVVRQRPAGRVTRNTADACIDCDRACKNHRYHAYLECSKCQVRRSIEHKPSLCNEETKALGHCALQRTWHCPACAK
jgi:hypothetical protein